MNKDMENTFNRMAELGGSDERLDNNTAPIINAPILPKSTRPTPVDANPLTSNPVDDKIAPDTDGNAPAATDTGLVTVAWQRKHPTEGWMDCREEDIPHYVKRGQEVRELSPRSQAEELLAAERAKYRDAMEKLVESQRETLVWQQRAIDLKADNAAKDARIKELQRVETELCTSIGSLEARLAAAEKALEAADTAITFADKLIERGYGSDTPREWHKVIVAAQKARAVLGGKPS